ncbi:Brix domain-containing protein [Phascolomyces articulosus]|uniref:Ribosome production factor 2 homolog n=1 Tax=Phascolomyces articulosus TaxID=60185 RepID=A0AAD5JPD9_9FUNG|nr:Brix domain-containing protein [Phascolomyces articulosus]
MLIHLFISHGDIKSAKLVVDGMMRSNYPPDTITVKTIVNGLTYKNQLGEINEFYQTLQERDMWPETTELYRMMVWIFANRDDVEGARHYYAAYLKKQNIMTEDPKNMDSVYNAMIQVYGSVNQPEGALAVYKQMIKRGHPAPTTATYHILLGLLRQYKMQDQMDKVYQDLKQAASAKDGSVEINGSHLSAMGWKPKQVLSEMHALGIPCNVRDYNTFIVSYVKKNKFQDALDIYNHMVQAGVEPDVYSYSIILDTLVKDHEQPAQAAFDFYEVIKEQGLSPDVVIYTSLISACAKTEDLDKAMSLLKEMESFGLHPNVYTFNSLFGLLSRKKQLKLPDDMECVNLLWDKMKRLKVNPDTRSYNMHFALLAKMMQPSIVKEEYTGSSTMEWMGKGIKTSPPLNRMLQLYKSMKQHCRPDFASHTIMINTLVASGHLRQAMQVYEDAKIARSRLPVSVYNEIMGALEKAKRMSQIMTIWHDMKAAQVLPDDRTKAKNARTKRFLKNREAKVHENPKTALIVKGSTTSQIINDALKDLYSLKRANGVLFSKKNELKPFEDESKLEFFSRKNDASLMVVGSHSKKRPHNLTFIRMFDHQVLDMYELGVENLTPLSEIKGPKCSLGIKPLMIFNGDKFDSDDTFKNLKNYFLDFFNGEVVDGVDLAGLEYVMSFTASPNQDDPRIMIRSYLVQMKKSGSKTPRVELEEMGPMMDLVAKKEKNKARDDLGDQYGRVHVGKQDFDKIQTRKMKGLKRRRDDEDEEEGGEAVDGGDDDEPMTEDA